MMPAAIICYFNIKISYYGVRHKIILYRFTKCSVVGTVRVEFKRNDFYVKKIVLHDSPDKLYNDMYKRLENIDIAWLK